VKVRHGPATVSESDPIYVATAATGASGRRREAMTASQETCLFC